MSTNILQKAAYAIYLTAGEEVAKEISDILFQTAEEMETQQARIKELEKAGKTLLAMKEQAEVQAIQGAMRVEELEAKITRLTSRGIEDMKFRIKELEAGANEVIKKRGAGFMEFYSALDRLEDMLPKESGE